MLDEVYGYMPQADAYFKCKRCKFHDSLGRFCFKLPYQPTQFCGGPYEGYSARHRIIVD